MGLRNRLRWRWFCFKHELLRGVVCRRRGHAIVVDREDPLTMDAIQYSARCDRCRIAWLPVTITHSVLVASEDHRRLVGEAVRRYVEECRTSS